MIKDKKNYITGSEEETNKLGQDLIKEIVSGGNKKGAAVITLQGELGAGKTHFTQGLAQGLGIEETVNSPTFVVMRQYKIPINGWEMFYHIDCYRMAGFDDLKLLGLEDILKNPKNIVVVEWPEIAGEGLLGDIRIEFKVLNDKQREICVYEK